jgi:hypothetical protein
VKAPCSQLSVVAHDKIHIQAKVAVCMSLVHFIIYV